MTSRTANGVAPTSRKTSCKSAPGPDRLPDREQYVPSLLVQAVRKVRKPRRDLVQPPEAPARGSHERLKDGTRSPRLRSTTPASSGAYRSVPLCVWAPPGLDRVVGHC